MKALLRFYNYDAPIHTLTHLLGEVKRYIEVSEEYLSMARELDKHYIMPRYPDGFASGYPGEFYDAETAKKCIDYAQKILQFVESKLS